MEAAGGEVMWWNGERVMGVLAVSRSIGDHYLRPFVIAQPEVPTGSPCPVPCSACTRDTRRGVATRLVYHQSCMWCRLQVTILSRVPEDELLLLASDGLWDVMSNQVCSWPLCPQSFSCAQC